jgi:hypothetical protein
MSLRNALSLLLLGAGAVSACSAADDSVTLQSEHALTLGSGEPDLIVTQVTGPAEAVISESFTATVTIANQGPGDANAFSYVNFAVYLSTDNQATIDANDICVGYAFMNSAPLTAGGSATAEIILFADATTPTGPYYLVAAADTDCNGVSLYSESDETNNVLVGNQISVNPSTAQVDLTITDLIGDRNATRGTYYRLDTYLTNLGPDPAPGRTPSKPAYLVAWYLSTDQTITTDDTFIGSYSGNSLGAGETFRFFMDVLVPADIPRGFYYWGAIADYTGILGETNETNNAVTGNRVNVR